MDEMMLNWIIPIFMVVALLAATGAAITLCAETWLSIRHRLRNDREAHEVSALNDLWRKTK